ncbi:hypothetical protein [Candidatus Laterigemmans baculatus]|uniref:hypothetical protein n=1 Tax=Candidatus Laterigemmans baculatus TaxID=2770505 RepID=UPI0013DCB63D|nr:hypothetical protein [Candidatus Laterigemmans baculatus]
MAKITAPGGIGSKLDQKGTSVMRLSLRSIVVAAAVAALGGTADSASAQEFIVNSQVISDEVATDAVVSGAAAGDAVAGGAVVAGDAGYYLPGRTYGSPDLFYNYYTQGYSNAVNAQMYVSPLPVPPYVGHTFYTYQPLLPEHYLYWHKDRYHNHYDGGRGLNRTRAVYYSPPARTAAQNVYWNWLRIPR